MLQIKHFETETKTTKIFGSFVAVICEEINGETIHKVDSTFEFVVNSWTPLL